MAAVFVLLLIFLAANTPADGLWLTIPNSGTKCVSEEIHANVVVLADYYVINDTKPEHTRPVSVKVTSPYGSVQYHKENVTQGQFAFTTSEGGNYLACFWHDDDHQQHETTATTALNLDWRVGIAAKDWDSIARKEKIEGVELELRKLEGSVESILSNLVYLKEREAELREVSEKTNARVAWYSIMSLGICIVVSAMQIFHLKHFFQKKKLI